MAIIKCKHCGADIEATEQGLIVCQECGGLQTAPIMNNAKKIEYFNLATRLRLAKDYNKAYQMYSKLAEQFDEVEPYYGKVLCKYGVQYFDEDVICEKENFVSVIDDEDYQHACEIATDDEFELLEQESQLIDDYQSRLKKKARLEAEAKAQAEAKAKEEAQRKEAEKAKKEKEFRGYYQEAKAFDIFILVSDKDRKKEVYQLAKTMAVVLKEDGKSVFFPHVDLKGLEDGDPKKEAYLQKALETSKIMILFAGANEELEFYKVKDRLDSYVDLMANDDTKVLVPCFQNLGKLSIPASIKSIKSIDLSSETFIDDIMDKVDKVFQVKVEPLSPEEKYYNKAVTAISNGDFDNATKNVDLCIKSNSKFKDIYRLGILVSYKFKTDEELKTLTEPIEDNKYYKMAIVEGDTSVEALANIVNENIYSKAVAMPRSTEDEVKAFVDAITPIKNYKDSQKLIDDAFGPIYEPKYQEAMALLQKGFDTKFERFILEAVRALSAIIPYKDSAEKAEEGKAFVEKLNDDLYKESYDKAKELYNNAANSKNYPVALQDFKAASQLFIKFLSYKDARAWNLKCREMEYLFSLAVILQSEVVQEIKDAIAVLNSLKPYKDADNYITQGEVKIRDLLDPKKQKKKKK